VNRPSILTGQVPGLLLLLNIVVLFFYMSWWFDFSHIDNIWLYGALFFGEIYHAVMALTFWFTVRQGKQPVLQEISEIPKTADIFITVAGEPIDVVEKTVAGAKEINFPGKEIYILNDSFVAGKKNWRDYESLALKLGVRCITRKIPGGNKAGNFNNALKCTAGEVVVILDADMVPHRDFFEKTLHFFRDPKTGFVQTPQYYKNHKANFVAGGAWEQQQFFFGPIMVGKAKSNASFICGTNVVIRREAILQVGGMNEKNIAEDFLTSLSIHQKGWKSYYVPEVLAEGLAPEDLLSYFKQQLRWARGSLEVLFSANPLFKGSLKFGQKLEYLSSALYYFNGPIVLIDIAMPLVFLFTGLQPVLAATTSFAIFFVPFMALNLLTLYMASGGLFTFRAAAFSQSSWTLQILALLSVASGQKMGFSVTPKKAQQGNYLYLVAPHIFYFCLFLAASIIGIEREGLTPAVVTNIAWGVFNIVMFLPFVYAAVYTGPEVELAVKEKVSVRYGRGKHFSYSQ
jgi:cellulose synthase (UDP-forming)